MHQHSVTATRDELAFWEAQLPSPARPLRREVPVGLLCGRSSLLQDLADGKPDIADHTMASLRGGERFKQPVPVDPDIPRHGLDPQRQLETEVGYAAELRRAEQRPLLVRRLLRELPEKQAAVLRLRYGIGCSPVCGQQIAAMYGCSRKHVWELEKRALATLRTLVGAECAGAPNDVENSRAVTPSERVSAGRAVPHAA